VEIKGFVEVSLVDWDGKVSSVIFLSGCNMRCPFCYNATLVLRPQEMPTIPFRRVEDRLKKSRGWIDGVVITGGEPTIHKELFGLCEKIKALDLLVKVDTNGTNPRVVEELVKNRLVDYVAVDVKAPLNRKRYSEASGVDAGPLLENIEGTIDFLMAGGIEHEFRTTLVPTLHAREDVVKICQRIKGCRKYALQNFRSDAETINPSFRDLRPFRVKEMQSFLAEAKRFVPNAVLRGVQPATLQPPEVSG